MNFINEFILIITRNLDENKAHGQEVVSTRMIKLCDMALLKPFSYYSTTA